MLWFGINVIIVSSLFLVYSLDHLRPLHFLTRTHARTHARAHAHIQTHTYTHIHMHTNMTVSDKTRPCMMTIESILANR